VFYINRTTLNWRRGQPRKHDKSTAANWLVASACALPLLNPLQATSGDGGNQLARILLLLRFVSSDEFFDNSGISVHYQDVIANEFHHAQIMGNEHVGEVKLRL